MSIFFLLCLFISQGLPLVNFNKRCDLFLPYALSVLRQLLICLTLISSGASPNAGRYFQKELSAAQESSGEEHAGLGILIVVLPCIPRSAYQGAPEIRGCMQQRHLSDITVVTLDVSHLGVHAIILWVLALENLSS